MDDTAGSRRIFEEGLASGRLLYSSCTNCGQKRLPPRVICDVCGSKINVFENVGKLGGTLLAVTSIYYPSEPMTGQAPYALGIVELDVGLRLMCHISTDTVAGLQGPGARGELFVDSNNRICKFKFSDPSKS